MECLQVWIPNDIANQIYHGLYIKAEVHDITILYHVVLALYGQLSGLADSGLRTVLQIVLILDDLCTDESLLNIFYDTCANCG